jgi:hypothetical protein
VISVTLTGAGLHVGEDMSEKRKLKFPKLIRQLSIIHAVTGLGFTAA